MADNSKAKKFLNWVPSMSRYRIKKVYNWCEKNFPKKLDANFISK